MRESGILMHITSLPGAYGIGTMGREAFAFVDFLHAAGQHCWQILPLNPTGYGDSPYQSCCAYAGNHYLIDLEQLVQEGLLEESTLGEISWGSDETRVDFGLLYQNRLRVLRLAYSRFQNHGVLNAFCEENRQWLPDFALFMALKDRFDGKPWYAWPEDMKFRKPEAIARMETELAEEIRFYCFVQYLFYKQWGALRQYANSKNIRIIGDVPIYVPYDSVEVWQEPKWFQLDDELTPTAVAGCPPDGFTEDGQLWGNPLYRWDVMQADGYRWWLRRLSAAEKLYDTVRLDHFRGFASYWSVPYGDTTARNGHWVKGPGMDFIRAVKAHLPQMDMIAEDLGFLTEEVLALRDESAFPGMKVLEFAFDSKEPSDYLPHNYIANSVCYIGTHDNMTLLQWLETSDPETVAYAADYMGLRQEEGPVWGVIRCAMATVSQLCILQMQDLLELGAEARMNFPGTMSSANWTWRAKAGFTDGLASRLYEITKLYGRLVESKISL